MTRLRLSAGAVLLGLLAACGPTSDPSAAPVIAPRILACIGISQVPCANFANRVGFALPPERGAPASMQIQLYGCDPAACDPSVLNGQITVEWADGGEPSLLSIGGPRADPILQVVNDAIWSGLVNPSSKRVPPGVPVPLTLGHCGLLHVVDFDGSFWVPIGQLGDDPATINAVAGQMTLVGPDRAQFASGGRVIATLARFPGPKHFWLCA